MIIAYCDGDDDDDDDDDDDNDEVQTVIRSITKLRDDGTIYNMKKTKSYKNLLLLLFLPLSLEWNRRSTTSFNIPRFLLIQKTKK